MQDCPQFTVSFRQRQCESFNSATQKWTLPVLTASDLIDHRLQKDLNSHCSLHCRSSVTGKVAMVTDKVTDGTRCQAQKSFGVCIDGKCEVSD